MMLLEPGGDEGVMEPILQVFRDLGRSSIPLTYKSLLYPLQKSRFGVVFKTIFHLFLNSLFTLFFVMRVSHISYHIHTDNEVVSISHLIALFPGLGLRKLPSSIV